MHRQMTTSRTAIATAATASAGRSRYFAAAHTSKTGASAVPARAICAKRLRPTLSDEGIPGPARHIVQYANDRGGHSGEPNRLATTSYQESGEPWLTVWTN